MDKGEDGRCRMLKKLTARYTSNMKKRMRAKDINAEDLAEIKHDISALRSDLSYGYNKANRRKSSSALPRLSPSCLKKLK